MSALALAALLALATRPRSPVQLGALVAVGVVCLDALVVLALVALIAAPFVERP